MQPLKSGLKDTPVRCLCEALMPCPSPDCATALRGARTDGHAMQVCVHSRPVDRSINGPQQEAPLPPQGMPGRLQLYRGPYPHAPPSQCLPHSASLTVPSSRACLTRLLHVPALCLLMPPSCLPRASLVSPHAHPSHLPLHVPPSRLPRAPGPHPRVPDQPPS